MASKDINTVTNATTFADRDYIFLSKDQANLQKIRYDIFCDQLYNAGYLFSNVAGTSAGSHNSIYRGKDLGTSFTPEQANEISVGRFTDMFIGDYWTINGRQYRIAAFDPFYRCGDNISLGHHIAVVPSTFFYNAQMHITESGAYANGNENNITTGAYNESDMRATNLLQATAIFEEDFGANYVLSYRDLLPITTGTFNGYNCQAIASAWRDCKVELMTETMVFGSPSWGISPYEVGCCTSQFPLFKYSPDYAHIRGNYWLRNTASVTSFVMVTSNGTTAPEQSSNSRGVRPFGLIGQ